MATILITGGTGLIGASLTELLLSKGHKVIILTRNLKMAIDKQSADERLTYARWNAEEQSIDRDAIEKANYIVHLAGAGVADKRWTSKRKKEIVQSRIQSSGLLIKALKDIPNNIKAVVSASAIGWYGPDAIPPVRPGGFTESDPSDKAFLGETCRWWEESIQPVTELGKRLIKFRFGIVLANDGGALAEFKKPVQFGIASILGNGKQVVSWIHIDDVCRLIVYAIENDKIEGVYNAVAPNPVTNKNLTLHLAQRMRGKSFIAVHVPSWVLSTMLGGMSTEVLKSATVSAEKMQQTGFQFLYPQIDAALNELIKR
ncbi:MAG: TIGR01777 family protein [Chitinophagaceae bacterium]|nr:TIGR01777 family protein [Chitinophagaceae bacterium]